MNQRWLHECLWLALPLAFALGVLAHRQDIRLGARMAHAHR